jgi:hypothetical protein
MLARAAYFRSRAYGWRQLVSEEVTPGVRREEAGNSRLSLLLAAAMFVLVVDTSLMNVSISQVVKDLDLTLALSRARSRSRPWSPLRSS